MAARRGAGPCLDSAGVARPRGVEARPAPPSSPLCSPRSQPIGLTLPCGVSHLWRFWASLLPFALFLRRPSSVPRTRGPALQTLTANQNTGTHGAAERQAMQREAETSASLEGWSMKAALPARAQPSPSSRQIHDGLGALEVLARSQALSATPTINQRYGELIGRQLAPGKPLQLPPSNEMGLPLVPHASTPTMVGAVYRSSAAQSTMRTQDQAFLSAMEGNITSFEQAATPKASLAAASNPGPLGSGKEEKESLGKTAEPSSQDLASSMAAHQYALINKYAHLLPAGMQVLNQAHHQSLGHQGMAQPHGASGSPLTQKSMLERHPLLANPSLTSRSLLTAMALL